MLTISFPKTVDLVGGVEATVNGFKTTVKRDNAHLVYTDAAGRVNRCQIIAEVPVGRLPMPDGSVVEGTMFTCASHGQDHRQCRYISGSTMSSWLGGSR